MRRLLFLLLTLILGSCAGSNAPSVGVLPQVVVVFDHAPLHEYYTQNEGAYGRAANEGVSYLDSMFNVTNFVPSPDGIDTLVLPTFDGLAEMYYTYWAMERVEYLFKAGDTIRFKYLDRDYPYAQCINNPAHDKLYNKIDVANGWRMENGFSAEAILTSFPMEIMTCKPALANKIWFGFIPPVDNLIQSYKHSRAMLQKHLDSLSLADRPYYERVFYMQSLADRKAERMINLFLDSTEAKIDQNANAIAEQDDPIGTYSSQLNDERINSLTYQSHELNSLSNQIAAHYAPIMNYTSYVGDDDEDGGTFFDHRVTFDTIANSKRIPQASKRLMLRRLFDDFQFAFSSVDQEIHYRQRYDSITADTTMRSIVKELETSLTLTDDLYLKSIRGRTAGLKEVLARHKGKVIYVSYWGSGCPPCIRVMPDAAKLREEFKGTDVVFIYLSYDKDDKVWKDAIRKNDVDGENFMMTNQRVALMVKDLKIHEYPRYMIYDRLGKLVRERASGPSYPEARKQLLKYLNN